MPTYSFDRSLAAEFRAKPVGEHSPALQQVLNIMRGAPLPGKYVLICVKPYQEWVLGQLSGQAGVPVQILTKTFNSLSEAEWSVFKLRWKALTGETLEELS